MLDVLDSIPLRVAADIVDEAEKELVDLARTMTPTEITKVGARILAHLDPDGTLTEPRDRARRRQLWLGKQDAQMMSVIKGRLDPLTRAKFETLLAAWAAPGRNNPDDDAADRLVGGDDDTDSDQLKAAVERDSRTQAQRNHDALAAMLDVLLDGGHLGKTHRGLPPHLIVSITANELRDGAGIGRTATGSLLPMSDVVKVAARAQQHLVVFADHSAEVLYFGRARRLASQAQRLALADSYGGCSAPGCTRPATHTEIHHAAKDWALGGATDITTLAPACAQHNRRVGPDPGQYTTSRITEDPDAGLFAWTLNAYPGFPPNPPQVNRYFRAGRPLPPRALPAPAAQPALPAPAAQRALPAPVPRRALSAPRIISTVETVLEQRLPSHQGEISWYATRSGRRRRQPHLRGRPPTRRVTSKTEPKRRRRRRIPVVSGVQAGTVRGWRPPRPG